MMTARAQFSWSNINWINFSFILLLALYLLLGAFDKGVFLWMHLPNLLIHEIGHPVFGIFGYQPLMVIGGTLMQLLVPLGCAAYFVIRKQYYSAAICGFWFGINFFDVAWYLRDAQFLKLPLVSMGGGDVIHDWNFLLDRWHVLGYAWLIGTWVERVGWVVLLISLAAGAFFCYQPREDPGKLREDSRSPEEVLREKMTPKYVPGEVTDYMKRG